MVQEPNVQLIQLFERTVSSEENELETAQRFLEQPASTNLVEFMKALSEVLACEANSPVARMAAGLQLKNCLTSTDTELKQDFQQGWLTFPLELRSYVKKNILAALGTETNCPSSAAQCVAYMAVAELNVNQWPELITVLITNVITANSTDMVREATLEAIVYICQDIDAEVLAIQSNEILTAIVHGMKREELSNHVRLAATTALLNSLEFTKANFVKESERHLIMQVVCEATQSPDTKVRVAALQCLVKIMSLMYYQHMEHHMAIEASEAAEMGRPHEHTSKFYAKGALQYLVPVLMQTLTKQEYDDEDDWNPCKDAGVCLMLLAYCYEDVIVPHVLSFVKENIENPDWRFRDTAVMAFGSILEGPNAEHLKPIVEQAMPFFFKLLYDQSVNVQDTAAWTIGQVCENIPNAAVAPANCNPSFKLWLPD